MSIYTRTGDQGLTDGPDRRRVGKDAPSVAAVGCLDELSSHVGLCLAAGGVEGVSTALATVQGELLSAGAALMSSKAAALDAGTVERMEKQIDSIWSEVGPLKRFILPGGCELACRLHVARTVCRRAERAVVALDASTGLAPPWVGQYLNRLGDLLFALARQANHAAGVGDVEWPASGGA